MIIVRNLKSEAQLELTALTVLAAKKMKTSRGRINGLKIVKRSLDSRKKDAVRWVYSVALSYDGDEAGLIARLKDRDAAIYEEPVYDIPQITKPVPRPVIAGFGPAGMFAALVLARAGACPIVLERGADVHTRSRAVEKFRSGGRLDPENNAQFGEGGAGTFSDGKLGTGTHDRRISWVLEQFAAHGAKPSVVYDAKPHVGTDVLVGVVESIRNEIISLGGEVRFNTKLTGLEIENGRLRAVKTVSAEKEQRIDCERLILAIGHSARDTFEELYSEGIPMERKPFSMGVRIEQLQKDTDMAQYGRPRGELPAADYSLNVHLPDGTSAYTFCMCPGGYVFAAASEEEGVVTNGMSYSGRSGENSNAALLVTLQPEDFPGDGVLAGMYWQREIERSAFRSAGGSYRAPAQLVGDFLARRASTGPGRIQPTYKPGVVWTELHSVLPDKICSVLEKALPELDKKLAGFAVPDAVMTAPETRSSSPVRIVRGSGCMSQIEGLYPCGEGAGYAGGITSAAVDGMRCAESVLSAYNGKDI